MDIAQWADANSKRDDGAPTLFPKDKVDEILRCEKGVFRIGFSAGAEYLVAVAFAKNLQLTVAVTGGTTTATAWLPTSGVWISQSLCMLGCAPAGHICWLQLQCLHSCYHAPMTMLKRLVREAV